MAQPFDANVSFTTARRREKEANDERLHAKTFGNWVNHVLAKSKYPKLKDLTTDLKDGVHLIHLLEALYHTKVDKKYHNNPSTEIHQIENVAIALELLKQHEPSIQLNSKDITDGNRKLTLGLIWRLIMSNQMLAPNDSDKSVSQRNKQAKSNLLDFVKRQTDGHGVEVKDLLESFYDGLAFAAMVDKLKPGVINWEEIKQAEPIERLRKAFEAAEKELAIPQLLDPEDLVNEDVDMRPDEKCMMTYISEFPLATMAINEQAREVELARAKERSKQLEEEIEREKQRVLKQEELRLQEKERELQAIKNKEEAAERLRLENLKLKEQQEQKHREAEAKKADLKTQNEIISEDNKRMLEEMQRLREANQRLQQELIATKQKLIGKLTIVVKEARNLPRMDLGGKCNPYVRLSLENQEQKTKVKKKTLNPKWDQSFEYFITDKKNQLEVEVMDWDRFLKDEFVGKFVVDIAELPEGKTDKWFELQSDNDKAQGELLLGLTIKYGK